MAYHRWHTAKMIPRAQRALFLVGVFSMGALAAATATGRHFALQAELIRAYPDKGWVLYLSRIAAAFFPMLLSVALFFKPVSRAIEARRLFQPLIFMVCGVAISIQSIPKTWFAIWGTEQARNLDEGAGLAYGEDHECSSTLHTRSVYWHAITLDSYAAIGSGMIGLRPEFAVVLVLYTVALQHAQLEALWTHSLVQWGTDDGKQLLPYIMRAMPMLTALLLSAVQDRNERKTFVAKTLLQLANTERIEQLKRDKDRLGWDIHVIERARPAGTVAPYAMRDNDHETTSVASYEVDRYLSTSLSSCDGVAATAAHHRSLRDDAAPAAASPAAPTL